MVALLIPISYRNNDSQVDIYRHLPPTSLLLSGTVLYYKHTVTLNSIKIGN